MKQIRRGVFETNSSSTHSLTMCSGDEFKRWENGEVYFIKDCWDFPGDEHSKYIEKQFINKDEARRVLSQIEGRKIGDEELDKVAKDNYLYTYNDYFFDRYLEKFQDFYITPVGEKVVAFGECGYDG